MLKKLAIATLAVLFLAPSLILVGIGVVMNPALTATGACVVPGRGGTQVQTTTIDEITAGFRRPVDLLKMDIQGGEGPAFLGASRSLRDRSVRDWVIGTHSPDLHHFCIQTLRHFNHRIIFEALNVEHQPDGLIVAATGRR